eukprot:1149915-Pelagomonas_calceolata.AAC.1
MSRHISMKPHFSLFIWYPNLLMPCTQTVSKLCTNDVYAFTFALEGVGGNQGYNDKECLFLGLIRWINLVSCRAHAQAFQVLSPDTPMLLKYQHVAMDIGTHWPFDKLRWRNKESIGLLELHCGKTCVNEVYFSFHAASMYAEEGHDSILKHGGQFTLFTRGQGVTSEFPRPQMTLQSLHLQLSRIRIALMNWSPTNVPKSMHISRCGWIPEERTTSGQ